MKTIVAIQFKSALTISMDAMQPKLMADIVNPRDGTDVIWQHPAVFARPADLSSDHGKNGHEYN